ncbi:MAG: Uma2 family endonuclease [Bacillota bacterium]
MEVREPPASYTEYCRLPEDAPRYEIIKGVGYLTPSPGARHQMVRANLGFFLYQYIRSRNLGEVYFAPFDVVLSETDVVQPDILYIAEDRLEIVRERGVFGAPDLVVEILSPAHTGRDRQEKLDLYQTYGVKEYWIVDIENRTVEVWISRIAFLDTRHLYREGKIRSDLLPGLEIGMEEIFTGVEKIRLE